MGKDKRTKQQKEAAADDMLDVAQELDRTPDMMIQLKAEDVFAVVATIQLASRHPGTRGSKTVKRVIEIARRMADELGAGNPTIERILERGWHPVFDEPPNPLDPRD